MDELTTEPGYELRLAQCRALPAAELIGHVATLRGNQRACTGSPSCWAGLSWSTAWCAGSASGTSRSRSSAGRTRPSRRVPGSVRWSRLARDPSQLLTDVGQRGPHGREGDLVHGPLVLTDALALQVAQEIDLVDFDLGMVDGKAIKSPSKHAFGHALCES